MAGNHTRPYASGEWQLVDAAVKEHRETTASAQRALKASARAAHAAAARRGRPAGGVRRPLPAPPTGRRVPPALQAATAAVDVGAGTLAELYRQGEQLDRSHKGVEQVRRHGRPATHGPTHTHACCLRQGGRGGG